MASLMASLAHLHPGDVALAVLTAGFSGWATVLLHNQQDVLVTVNHPNVPADFGQEQDYANVNNIIVTHTESPAHRLSKTDHDDVADDKGLPSTHPSVTFRFPLLTAFTIVPASFNLHTQFLNKVVDSLNTIKIAPSVSGVTSPWMLVVGLICLVLFQSQQFKRQLQNLEQGLHDVTANVAANKAETSDNIAGHTQLLETLTDVVGHTQNSLINKIATNVNRLIQIVEKRDRTLEERLENRLSASSKEFAGLIQDITKQIGDSRDLAALSQQFQNQIQDLRTTERQSTHNFQILRSELEAQVLDLNMKITFDLERKLEENARAITDCNANINKAIEMNKTDMEEYVKDRLSATLAYVNEAVCDLHANRDALAKQIEYYKESAEELSESVVSSLNSLQEHNENLQTANEKAVRVLKAFNPAKDLHASNMYANDIANLGKTDFCGHVLAWFRVLNYRQDATTERLNRGGVGYSSGARGYDIAFAQAFGSWK